MSMEAVYPEPASALSRGRRARTPGQRARRRTVPVTFAEIKEVDEENEESCVEDPSLEQRRRRPDLLSLPYLDTRRRRLRSRSCLLTEEATPAPASASATDSASTTASASVSAPAPATTQPSAQPADDT